MTQIRPLLNWIIPVWVDSGLRFQICGSIRRRAQTFGDVDVVVSDLNLATDGILSVMTGKCGVTICSSWKRFRQLSVDNIQIDLYSATSSQWGAMTLYLTGDFYLTRNLRAIARQHGLLLNQYGLFGPGQTLLAARTETQILRVLGLDWISPEQRWGKTLKLPAHTYFKKQEEKTNVTENGATAHISSDQGADEQWGAHQCQALAELDEIVSRSAMECAEVVESSQAGQL